MSDSNPQPPALASTRMVRTLDGARPWVRFFAVLSTIGVGLLVLGGTAFLFLGRVFYREVPFSSVLIGVLYLVLAAVMIWPTLLLHQYAGRLRDFVASGSVEDLEGAMERQTAFWKGYGILTIAAMSVGVVGSLVAVLTAQLWLMP